MKWKWLLVALVVACGGTAATTTAPAATNTDAPITTTMSVITTTIATTTTIDECPQAIQDGIDTFNILLDRMDADISAAAENVDEISAVVTDLADLMVLHCPGAEREEAFSELLVYFSEQANQRALGTSVVLESLLDGLCEDPPVELTLRGRAACA